MICPICKSQLDKLTSNSNYCSLCKLRIVNSPNIKFWELQSDNITIFSTQYHTRVYDPSNWKKLIQINEPLQIPQSIEDLNNLLIKLKTLILFS